MTHAEPNTMYSTPDGDEVYAMEPPHGYDPSLILVMYTAIAKPGPDNPNRPGGLGLIPPEEFAGYTKLDRALKA